MQAFDRGRSHCVRRRKLLVLIIVFLLAISDGNCRDRILVGERDARILLLSTRLDDSDSDTAVVLYVWDR